MISFPKIEAVHRIHEAEEQGEAREGGAMMGHAIEACKCLEALDYK